MHQQKYAMQWAVTHLVKRQLSMALQKWRLDAARAGRKAILCESIAQLSITLTLTSWLNTTVYVSCFCGYIYHYSGQFFKMKFMYNSTVEGS